MEYQPSMAQHHAENIYKALSTNAIAKQKKKETDRWPVWLSSEEGRTTEKFCYRTLDNVHKENEASK